MTKISTLRKETPLAKMNDAELLAGIRARMRLTVEGIEELAEMIREARRRNLSMAEFSTGMPARLLAVADKKLDAELLLKFCDQPAVLNAVKGTPLKLQKDLAAGATYPLVQIAHDGRLVTVEHTLKQTTGPQAQQAFVDGRLLTPDEQRTSIKKLQAAARVNVTRQGARVDRVKIEADVATKTVVVGGYRLKPADFTTAFKALGFKIERIT